MKHILILGAASEIAQATAKIFAKNGYSLTFAARNAQRLELLQKDLQVKYNTPIDLIEFDACNFASHSSFYKSLDIAPDVVLLCFGYLGDSSQFGKNFSEAHAIIDVNYTGSISICDIIANDFERKGTGSIIGVSSVAGDRGREGNYTYGSTKAGFTTYLSGLRQRLFNKGVHLMTVKPGFIATQMTAKLKSPKILTATPAKVGEDIYKSYRKKKDIIYTPCYWWFIMTIIKLIPEAIFKRLSL